MNLYGRNGNYCGAYISEIFSSIQGEGLYCGVRQLFIRFSGCNLRCSFCDAPSARGNPETCNVEIDPGTFRFRTEDNPIYPEKFFQLVSEFHNINHHSISLTGGEPLIQAKFLRYVLPPLKKSGHTVYLETNGTVADQLEGVLKYVDIIAMDIKLPSVSGTGELWYDHREFIRKAHNYNLFVKLVVDNHVTLDEIKQACSLVAGISPKIPMVLQPMTMPDGAVILNGPHIMGLQDRAMDILDDVRIIPQVHKFMGNIL